MLFKHELFAKKLIEFKGNQTLAYLAVYTKCSKKSAPSKASRLVRNGNILARTSELLYGNSYILEQALKEVVRGMNATKRFRVKSKIIHLPNYKERRLSAVTALKLLGALK